MNALLLVPCVSLMKPPENVNSSRQGFSYGLESLLIMQSMRKCPKAPASSCRLPEEVSFVIVMCYNKANM